MTIIYIYKSTRVKLLINVVYNLHCTTNLHCGTTRF